MNLDTLLSAWPLVLMVGFLARGLRGAGPPDPALRPRPGASAWSDEEALVEVPVTSDGVAFVPVGDALTLRRLSWLAPDIDLDRARAAGMVTLEVESVPEPPWLLLGPATRRGDRIERRSFTAARICSSRGGPWLLEVLGRDADYDFVPFQSLAGARAALGLLDRHAILLCPRDARGVRVPSSPEDFEEARRRLEECIRCMALGDRAEKAAG